MLQKIIVNDLNCSFISSRAAFFARSFKLGGRHGTIPLTLEKPHRRTTRAASTLQRRQGTFNRRINHLPDALKISAPHNLNPNSYRPASSASATATEPPPDDGYKPPTTGILSYLPPAFVPYAELARIDKPAGTIYLFFPCLFGTLLAAPLTTPLIAPSALLTTSSLFLLGAVIMRGAGCTINDLWDRNLDPHVRRTRHRPIARRAVTPLAALTFTSLQLSAGLAVLLHFPPACIAAAVPSLLLVATYPLAKRVTYYPQVVLGLAFSWGAGLGFPAVGASLAAHAPAAAALYASCVAWTVLYDMIYAHMDLRDDAAAGIKSIALAHAANTKAVLTGLGVVQVALLAGAGAAVGAGPVFFVGSCGGAAATLGTMIWRVRLESVDDCWWWFRYGCLFTGGAISAGLAAEYAVHWFG